jgi:hypothetical protein
MIDFENYHEKPFHVGQLVQRLRCPELGIFLVLEVYMAGGQWALAYLHQTSGHKGWASARMFLPIEENNVQRIS